MASFAQVHSHQPFYSRIERRSLHDPVSNASQDDTRFSYKNTESQQIIWNVYVTMIFNSFTRHTCTLNTALTLFCDYVILLVISFCV